MLRSGYKSGSHIGGDIMKGLKAFVDGILAGLVAHLGAWIALVTIDRLLYILGHIVVAIALRMPSGVGRQ